MSSNVGLNTPRGSGTSGYVQRNLSHFKPRENAAPYAKNAEPIRHRQRQPDEEILEHERQRQIEIQVFTLRDRLEEEGECDEDQIDEKCDALRKKLEQEQEKNGKDVGRSKLKSHQVHEMAKAKIDESEKLRKALGIRKDYEEGSHWKRQEERKIQADRQKEDRQQADRQRRSSREDSAEDSAEYSDD